MLCSVTLQHGTFLSAPHDSERDLRGPCGPAVTSLDRRPAERPAWGGRAVSLTRLCIWNRLGGIRDADSCAPCPVSCPVTQRARPCPGCSKAGSITETGLGTAALRCGRRCPRTARHLLDSRARPPSVYTGPRFGPGSEWPAVPRWRPFPFEAGSRDCPPLATASLVSLQSPGLVKGQEKVLRGALERVPCCQQRGPREDRSLDVTVSRTYVATRRPRGVRPGWSPRANDGER